MHPIVTARTLTLDPHQGGLLTLEQLAERHAQRLEEIIARYQEGKRGEALIPAAAAPELVDPEWKGNKTLVTCPRQGDTLTLKQLAERHGHTCYCITKRYKAGKRGEALIESVEETKRRAWRASHQRRKEGKTIPRGHNKPTAREMADGVLATREGRLASRLLKHYAA